MVACCRLSVSGVDRKKRAGEKEKLEGLGEKRASFFLSQTALAFLSPLTGSLEQANLTVTTCNQKTRKLCHE